MSELAWSRASRPENLSSSQALAPSERQRATTSSSKQSTHSTPSAANIPLPPRAATLLTDWYLYRVGLLSPSVGSVSHVTPSLERQTERPRPTSSPSPLLSATGGYPNATNPDVSATTVSRVSVSESPDAFTGSQVVASVERQSSSR